MEEKKAFYETPRVLTVCLTEEENILYVSNYDGALTD